MLYDYVQSFVIYINLYYIGLRLFGKSYSGLEYDYRGLCHVYEALGNVEKVIEYFGILNRWKDLRNNSNDPANVSNMFIF